MTVLYQLAVLGAPTEVQLSELRTCISEAIGKFNLRLGHEVGWEVLPAAFKPHQLHASAAVYFGSDHPNSTNLTELIELGIPVLPVVSTPKSLNTQIPQLLQPIQALDYSAGGAQLVSNTLLQCIGLLPGQRRVIISAHRHEGREAGRQLFDALSALQFEVFLDDSDLSPTADAKTLLWHKLNDSDVLIMLDTPSYFAGRWTSAEFGRVLAKGISVLRINWPDCPPSLKTATACVASLTPEDIHSESGRISEAALERICFKLEEVRSQNNAVRFVNLISNIRIAVQEVGGKIVGVGANKAVYIQLPGGSRLLVYPTSGVSVADTLKQAMSRAANQSEAVIFDHVGLDSNGLDYLNWMSAHAESERWIKASEAGEQFAKLEAEL